MYWPEHLEKGMRAAPAEKKGEKGDALLDAVIDQTGKKSTPEKKGRFVHAVFPTPAYESRFKSCLAKVPLECRMERSGSKRILALRPKNVQRFDEIIRTNGLANCETATKAVKWLRANPNEFLRFETH